MVDESPPGERLKDPPKVVMSGLHRRYARLWNYMPQYLQEIRCDFEKKGLDPELSQISVKQDGPGKNITARVSLLRANNCFNSHDKAKRSRASYKPSFLPWAPSDYSRIVIYKVFELSLPFHLTGEDMGVNLANHRNMPSWKIAKHRLRSLGKIALVFPLERDRIAHLGSKRRNCDSREIWWNAVYWAGGIDLR